MQPNYSSRRILLPVRHWFIWLSLIVAMLANMIPVGQFPLMPDWVAMVLIFWCIHQPLKVSMGTAFILGLAMDVADASVMGQHGLAYVLMSFVAGGLARRILWFPLAQQALHVLPILLFTQLVMMVARVIGGGAFPGFAWFLGSVVATLLWYPLTYLLLLPQFRPVDRDENRPI